MAAKFEVYIASKKYPSIKMCETIFPIVGKIQFSEKCIVWNGWLPTKEDVLYTQDDEQIELIDKLNLKKRIVKDTSRVLEPWQEYKDIKEKIEDLKTDSYELLQ